jgi:hypothetical protein
MGTYTRAQIVGWVELPTSAGQKKGPELLRIRGLIFGNWLFFYAAFGMPLLAEINPQVSNRCFSDEPR